MPNSPANERLSAYLDGELTEAEVVALEAELEAQPALRSELDQLKDVIAFLHDEGPTAAPMGFAARVVEQVHDEPMSTSWWAWLRRPFGLPIEGFGIALAAAAVLWIALPSTAPVHTDVQPDPKTRPGVAVVPSLDDLAPVESQPTPDVVGAKGQAAEKKATEPSKIGTTPKMMEPEVVAIEPPPAPTTKQPAQGTADVDELVNVPYRYTVYTQDADAQFRLQKIAARYGGQALSPSDKMLGGDELTDNGQVLAVVKVPANALHELEGELKQLGDARTEYNTDKLYRGMVDVSVTLKLVGGAPEPQAEGKDAARKSKQMDEDVGKRK